MAKVISIDPGMYKCGFILADIKQKKILKAEVIQSSCLVTTVKKNFNKKEKIELLLGNGTSCDKYIKDLDEFIPKLILVEEKNSTMRAKKRYFDIFPLKGLKCFLPREIFLLNKNLDALAALIIMEDHYNCKFEISNLINTKTWLK